MRDAFAVRVNAARVAFLCLALGAAGCGANEAGSTGREGSPSMDPDACEGRGEPIVSGMTKQSDDGLLTATLSDVSPVPPLQGLNEWTVDLETSTGPVLDADDTSDSLVIINIYMADHDHNLSKRGTMASPGIFEFPPLTVTMAGYWEFTVRVESDQSADEHEDVLFGFCVPKD